MICYSRNHAFHGPWKDRSPSVDHGPIEGLQSMLEGISTPPAPPACPWVHTPPPPAAPQHAVAGNSPATPPLCNTMKANGAFEEFLPQKLRG